MAMQILMGQYLAIATGELKGQIFQLNHYHKHLKAAYFPGPPQQLIPLDELELINMPFPYWRRQKDNCLETYPEPGTIQCDTLPIQEQINLCRERINRQQLSLSLCKKDIKKFFRKNEEQYLICCKLHDLISKEIRQENRFILLLKRIVPHTPLSSAIKQKIEQEFIAKYPHKIAGGNIAPAREEILQTTQPQEKLIFPPATKPKKRPGRPRGSKNTIPPSGWLDPRTAKDGTKTTYYCYHICKWTIDRIEIPSGQLPVIEHLIKENYPIEQIKKYLLGGKTNAVR